MKILVISAHADDGHVAVGRTISRLIEGEETKKSNSVRNILRRHGIRFKVDVIGNLYKNW